MRVYIFEGNSSYFGFTQDKVGSNLPAKHGPWSPFNAIDMERGESPRIAVDTNEALDNIQKHGFHLQRANTSISESKA